jgi:hypothetical protein
MRLKSALVATFAIAMLVVFGGALSSVTSSFATTPTVATAFVGTWQTTWKNPDGSTGTAPVIVRSDLSEANALDGVTETKGPNGVLYGSLSADGKTWSGDWWNSKGEKGTFTFTLKGRRSFNGSYTLEGTSGDFTWNGRK